MPHAKSAGRARPFLRLGFALFAAAAVFSPALSAHADTVFSNITGTTADQGYAVEGSATVGYQTTAQAFTPSGTYTMTGASVLMFASSPSSVTTDDLFNMSLFSDSGGVPGTEIASLGNRLAAPYQPGGLVTVATSGITLESGAEYWLALSPYDANSASGWAFGGSIATPVAFRGDPNGNWTTYDPAAEQFSISGTPLSVAATPEPGSLTLLFTGSLGGLAAIRRQRRAL